jgi:putative tryptophan/tyrosine transport system substrate-binding protein
MRRLLSTSWSRSLLEYDQYQQRSLQLLKETAPNIRRVALVYAADPQAQRLIEAGKLIGIEVMPFKIYSLAELMAALDAIPGVGVGALAMLPTPVYATYRKDIIAFASRHRLPAIYGNPELTDDGGLMVCGPSFFAMSRRLASFVDRILKGAKPAELPFEQAVQFDFKINLKTAKDLGLTVPSLVLQQATEVIE